MKLPVHASALGLAVALFDPGRASAEESAPIVLVPAHYDQAVGLYDSAGAGRVNADLIRNRPLARPGELLELVPGMIVTQHSSDGKANQYYMRGFNLDHGTDFATWVDGMPANSRSHAHGQGYTDLNFIIPELVQRIDYRKGPYFAEEGDFSSAGAARMRLRERLEQRVASVSAGEYGYRRVLLAGDGFDGRVLYALEREANDGPWEHPERLFKRNAVLRYHDAHGDLRWNVTAMAYRNRWNATDQLPQRAVASGAIGRYGAIDPSSGGATARYSLSAGARRGTADALTEADAYVVRSRLALFSNFTYALDRPDTGDQFEQSERRTLAGLNAAHRWKTQWAGAPLVHKLGVQMRHDRVDPVGLYHTRERVRHATVSEDAVRETSIGLFGESQVQWGPFVRSVAGLRLDRYRQRVVSHAGQDDAGATATQLSPKASLILGPWRKTELYLNAGRGFHSNDARAARDGVRPLAPALGYEIGLRSELLAGGQTSVSLWGLEPDSELVYVGDAGATEVGRASRRRGIELSHHAALTPWLLFDLDVALARARFRDADPAGRHVPGALERMASVGATVTAWGPWSANLNLRYFGARALIEDGSVRSSPTTLVNGRIGYRLSPALQLRLDGFNLANRKVSDIDYYYGSRLPGEAAEGVDDIHSHPVAPRLLRLTLSYQF